MVKPLDGMGGTSVFRVRESDPNRNVIVETVSQHGRTMVMVQRYLPEIVDGDKRILLDRRARSCPTASRGSPSRARRAATWPRAAAATRDR